MLPDLIAMDSFNWSQLLQPQWYIEYGGLWVLLFVVFAETGLFAGFFLPGDSLLFVAGIYSRNLAHEFLEVLHLDYLHYEWLDLLLLIGLISLAGIFGNAVGYWFGKKSGPFLFHRRDTLLFKKKYLYQARNFYEKYGGSAIVFARFIPIVRTFAPIVAGIVGMEKSKFSFYNVAGCIAWVFSMIMAGHFLQKWMLNHFNFDLKEHLELIVLGIVLVTTLPVLYKLFFSKRKYTSN